MSKRTWLRKQREKLQMTQIGLARLCGCTWHLIDQLELDDNWITHPNIAARMAHYLKLSADQFNQLVHASHHSNTVPEMKPIPGEADWKKYLYSMKKTRAEA